MAKRSIQAEIVSEEKGEATDSESTSKLFISYSRRDLQFAEKMVHALAEKDLDTWIDWNSIPKGEDWEEEIYRGIEQAAAFLFLVSPDSVTSEMCNKEIAYAVRNNKRIIPIVIRDASTKDFLDQGSAKEIARRNWIFCRQGKEQFSAAIQETITVIHTDYDWVKYHTRLLMEAREWDRRNRENSFLLRGKELAEAERQIAANSSRDPQSTRLQREYVLRSRQVSDHQRRLLSGMALLAAIVMTGLAIFGFDRARQANNARGTAVANASIAETERANAITAANERATAQANAEEQAKIALARQLAAQAQAIMATGRSRQSTAVLLAAQSMQLLPSSDAAQILQNNTLPTLVSRITNESSQASPSFSPDGKYIVSRGSDNFVHLWETATGQEIAHLPHADAVSDVAFSPDGKYVVSGSADKTVRVWEVATGQEIASAVFDLGIDSVAFSPDGKFVLSTGYGYQKGGEARVWEAFTGREVARLMIADPVNAIAFSADGKYVASGGTDKTVHVWEVSNGQEIAHIPYDEEISFVAFSQDNKYVLSQGYTIRVWEVLTQKEVARLTHETENNAVAFSPDGKYVATGGCDLVAGVMGNPCTQGTARVWETATGKELARITHGTWVLAVAFSPDGRYVVSGDQDGTTLLWEAATGKEITRMTQDGWVDAVAFSPDGTYVLSGGFLNSAGAEIRVWEASGGKAVTQMMHNGEVLAVAFSPDGRYVVSGSTDQTARVWETATGKELARMTSGGEVNAVAFSPDGKYVASGGCDGALPDQGNLCTSGTARVWEAATGAELAHMPHETWVSSVAFSPDGKHIVSGSGDGTILIWETETGREVTRMNAHEEVSFVTFSPHGKYLASGGCDMVGLTIGSTCPPEEGTVRVWQVSSGKEISRITYDNAVFAVAFSPDSQNIASASWDGTARVSEVTTGKEVARVTYDGLDVSSIAFSPDGKYVVSGGCDNFGNIVCTQASARVWEAATGKEIVRMNHPEGVSSVAFSPDGKYVVSGGCDRVVHDMDGICTQGILRVWEIATGKEIARMTHDNYVYSLAFSSDGRYIVSGSADGTARAWLYRPEDLIAEACARVARNLTPQEWNLYIGEVLPYPAKQEAALCSQWPVGEKG